MLSPSLLLPFSFSSPRQRDGAWALIRKTQSHIITLDETKEDNPVVRLWYSLIELYCHCFPTYHRVLALRRNRMFCSGSYLQMDMEQNMQSVSTAEAPCGPDPCWLNRLTGCVLCLLHLNSQWKPCSHFCLATKKNLTGKRL